jgi:hypothetical protein
MFYTYVLRCADGDFYIGSAADLRKWIAQHDAGGGSNPVSRTIWGIHSKLGLYNYERPSVGAFH